MINSSDSVFLVWMLFEFSKNFNSFSFIDGFSPKMYLPWICVPFLGSKIQPFFVISVGISIPSKVIVGIIFPLTFDMVFSSSDKIIIWNMEFNG